MRSRWSLAMSPAAAATVTSSTSPPSTTRCMPMTETTAHCTQRSFTAPGMRPPKNIDMTGACGGTYTNFSGNIGIVGTPVIDAASGTIYFVARSTTGSTFVQDLHAVSILDGNEIAGSPKRIIATYSGTGDGSFNGMIAF